MTVVTPGRCGLYETARELVSGLQKCGVDSRLVDPTLGGKKPNALYPKDVTDDRGAPLASMEWAVDADIVVNHSGYDGTPVYATKQPVVHVAHGRPRNSFISEVKGSTPIYTYWYAKNLESRLKAVVTFWPQHKPYLEVMFPGKPVHHVQSCVDLDAWKFDGPSGYSFHNKGGRCNIVISDHFADDICQFVPLNAACLFAREQLGTKLHFYAHPQDVKDGQRVVKRGFNALVKRIKDDGNLGELTGWVSGLDNVYRAATMVLTANEIDTRTVREATACGCPVVRVTNLDDGWQVPMRKAMRMTRDDRYVIRKMAEARFDPTVTARQFKEVLGAN
jgi:glycosyltransferase involved in cell wall biosynthesis